MTAATFAAGTRSRHAGILLALGHALVELPLIVLLIAGVGSLLQFPAVKTAIGLAGGIFLLIMGAQLLVAARKSDTENAQAFHGHPFRLGIILSIGNPYFLIWWATVGLALVTQAAAWGMLALVLFALIHWLCDLVWYEALSQASFKGSDLLGARLQQGVLLFCGVMLSFFGCKFLYDALAV